MAKPEENLTSQVEEKESNLRGSLISVGILGAVIIGSWIGVWALYLAR